MNNNKVQAIVEKVKELVQRGNVSRIVVRKGERVLLNIPVNVGIVGGVVAVASAKWVLLASILATVGFGCCVEVVREDGGVNPYKPYDGHEDPADLDFDERVVLPGSGQAAVETQYVDDVSSLTDFVYGKDGEVVAHYSYYECPSKEAADRLMDYLIGAERVDDTVVMVASTGAEMEQTLTMLTGYNVIKDKSVDEYVRMIEETYYSSVCEE